ncbi:MAG TPA: MCE family protein, partial [Actinomycetota bacterium]|nr:MCE family protein [Actinomycetota bacterium]
FLNELGPVLRAIDPEEANAFIHAMNQALTGNEATVRLLLDSGAHLATELGSIDRQIKSLIGSSDEALGIYARQSDDLGRLIDDLDTVGGKLAGMTGAINSLLVNFAVVQEELDELLSENRGNIDATLSGLLDITRLLDDNRGALERTLCTLPAGVVSYDQTSSWGEWFNVRIVEFVVKDENSREIASSGELQQQRGNRDPRGVAVCPRGESVRKQLREGHGRLGGLEVQPEEARLPEWLDTITGASRG